MQVFKHALKLVFRFPVYLLVYIVMLSLIGLLLSISFSTPTVEGFEKSHPPVAVIDRDQSALSQAINDFLAERSTPVYIEDNTRALQDATAQNLTPYILVIPEGYEEDFIAAVDEGGVEPKLQTVVNYSALTGLYMDEVTNQFVAAIRMSLIADPSAGLDQILERADAIASLDAPLEVVSLSKSTDSIQKLSFFFQWSAYPLTSGIVILVAMVFSVFQTGELRRRNLCTPMSSVSMNIQIAISSVSVALMSWLFISLLGLLPFNGGSELVATNPLGLVLMVLCVLVYTSVPLSIGFFLSQLGLKEMAINGISNIVSLAFMFLSGIFMGGITFMDEAFQAIAHVIPTYWYMVAIESLAQVSDYSAESLAPIAGSLGIILLFAATIFSVALLIGRLRVQTADAGGNTGADIKA